jgi:hypothetical protein
VCASAVDLLRARLTFAPTFRAFPKMTPGRICRYPPSPRFGGIIELEENPKLIYRAQSDAGKILKTLGFRLAEKLSPRRHGVTENHFSCFPLWLRVSVVERISSQRSGWPARPGQWTERAIFPTHRGFSKNVLPLCVFERIPLSHFEQSARAWIRPNTKPPSTVGRWRRESRNYGKFTLSGMEMEFRARGHGAG